MSRKQKVIDSRIKKSITDDVDRIISDISRRNPNYKEKQSFTWYDSINVVQIDLLTPIPNELINKLKDNPYVISKSVKKIESKDKIDVSSYTIQFHVYPNDNCITKIKTQIYHMKRKYMLLYLTINIIVFITLLYFIMQFFIYMQDDN